jgi:hypothetical protein
MATSDREPSVDEVLVERLMQRIPSISHEEAMRALRRAMAWRRKVETTARSAGSSLASHPKSKIENPKCLPRRPR